MKKMLGEGNVRKGGIAEEIANLKQRREARKLKEDKKIILQLNQQNPNNRDMDSGFQKLLIKKKDEIIAKNKPHPVETAENSKIFVVVRKRPLMQKEIANGEIDCVSVINPKIYIHECKIQIDGYTKYLEDHEYYFDDTFGEKNSTDDVYNTTISPLINLILNGGIVTCFAYGQTGSGKTYTMKGIESQAIDELFYEGKKAGDKFDFYISFFEIYGGRLYDLLNNRNKLQVLDDKKGKTQIYGLINQIAETPEMMHHIIDSANAIRTTHNTVTNETSSRSHAICNIVLKKKGSEDEFSKLSLVDLAGSERAQETKSNNRQRRAEGAEINKSLLALKECIRALDEKKNNPDQHVPFRASKLTHVLRDSFVSKSDKSRIVMISCVNPSYNSANHSINTLRYSDRLKEKTKRHFGGNYNNLNYGERNMNSKENINNYNYNMSSGLGGLGLNINNNNNSSSNINSSPNPNQNSLNNNYIKNNNNNNINLKGQKSKEFKPNGGSKNNLNFNKKSERKVEKQENENKIIEKNFMDHKISYKADYKADSKADNNNNNSNNNENINTEEEDDWNYMKKTVAKRDGIFLNDDMIKYHQLTDKLIEDEDDIINTHMKIVKEDAQLLTKEGNIITNIKGVGEEEDFKMDEYVASLEEIVNRKIKIYGTIIEKIENYKKDIKQEDYLRKKLGMDED